MSIRFLPFPEALLLAWPWPRDVPLLVREVPVR